MLDGKEILVKIVIALEVVVDMVFVLKMDVIVI
jgi:hypothetical protein